MEIKISVKEMYCRTNERHEFVEKVHYTALASKEGKSIMCEFHVFFPQGLDYKPYLPIKELTEEIVIDWWKKNDEDVKKFYHFMEHELDNLKKFDDAESTNLELVTPLPWQIKS